MKFLYCPVCGSFNCNYNPCSEDYTCVDCDETFQIDDNVIGVPETYPKHDTELIPDKVAKDPFQSTYDEVFWSIVKKNF